MLIAVDTGLTVMRILTQGRHDPRFIYERFPSLRHEHGTVCQPKWRRQIPYTNQTKITFILGVVSSFQTVI